MAGKQLPLVLITGVNGYIAAHTAAVFLKAGYAVRGTVRSLRQTPAVDSLVKTLKQYHDDDDRFELVEVPDISAPGAFDRAVEGVQAVAHLASPVSMTETDPAPMMRAAVEGTTSLLKSAQQLARAKGNSSSNKSTSTKSPILNSVVLMSTVSAIFSPARPPHHVFTEADWNDVAEEEVQKLGKQTPGSGYAIYQASKTAAERAFWKFEEDERPEFGMTALCPAPVLGPPLYVPEPISKLSMRVKDIYDMLHGGAIPEFNPVRSTFVDVRDVATLVLRAVEQDAAASAAAEKSSNRASRGKNRYLLVGQSPVSPQTMADILRARYPDRVDIIQEGTPGQTYPDMTWRFASSKAGELLGREWIGLEKSVVDSAEVFLTPENY